MAAEEILKIENLQKSFGDVTVLDGIDLTVRRGEAIVIIGASGSGKSTLLRCVNLLEIPSGGRIFLQGKLIGSAQGRDGAIAYRETKLRHIRAQIGMVFQQFNLFPHLTAEQNVMIGPMRVLGLKESDAREQALANLTKMGIAEKAKEYPSRLSGGQQQRVAIARALTMKPQIMLFDEATSALDPELVGEVLLAMRRLAEEGMTMLIVTHELGFAYNVADRIIFLREGKIYDEGTPEEVLGQPKKAATQEFLKGHTLFQLPSRGEAQARQHSPQGDSA
ncbi:MAG: amino acid ABC transporter ATP-binding protein [Variibacter sp.]